jgi:cardiolipin synthase
MSLLAFWQEFGPWLVVAWVIYLVVLSVWIVLQKREPIATLSWLLSLALLPVLGLVIYHFLGPRRVRRQRQRRRRLRVTLQESLPPGLTASPDATAVARMAQSCTGYAPSSASGLALLVGGGATFDAILLAIGEARQHLHLQYYIFHPDHTGTRVRDALVAAARRGVRIRLLLDGIGSISLGADFLAPMRAAGIELAWFHPVRVRWSRRPKMNLCNHRKLVVVDGLIGFTGGINITDDQNERVNPQAFHDLHLRLEGSIVRWLQLAFLEDWQYATGVALRDSSLWPDPPAGQALAQVLTSGPDSPWEAIHRVQVEAIHQANARVWLATPYFVPGEAARMALTSAARRGLDVRLMLPARADSRLVSAAAKSYYEELLESGVRVFEYGPRMMHSKVLLIDDAYCLMGSANFDHRSFRLNFELGVLVHDPRLGAAILAQLGHDLGSCREIVPGRKPEPALAQLGQAVARLFSPLL